MYRGRYRHCAATQYTYAYSTCKCEFTCTLNRVCRVGLTCAHCTTYCATWASSSPAALHSGLRRCGRWAETAVPESSSTECKHLDAFSLRDIVHSRKSATMGGRMACRMSCTMACIAAGGALCTVHPTCAQHHHTTEAQLRLLKTAVQKHSQHHSQ